jgi:uncharacterized protein YndB with AHSA1/START domain
LDYDGSFASRATRICVDRRARITYASSQIIVERLRLGTVLPAEPATVYDCWITAKRHAEMTGSSATSEAKKGGTFTAWDGYITGKHLVLEPSTRIVQAWRTTEFPSSAPDSTVEIRLSKVPKGTKISLLQSDIPDGQSDMYAEGWIEYYFDPMTRYFEAEKKKAPEKPKAKAKSKPARSKKRAKKAKPKRAASAPKPKRKAPPKTKKARKKR